MTLFKNKYRIESTRLKGWDYSATGVYFVTLCTRDRKCFFGEVVNGETNLSPIGDIVAEEWQKTAAIRPNVELDVWIVMPNHLHGIIIINQPSVETFRRNVSTRNVSTRNVSTRNASTRNASTRNVSTRDVPMAPRLKSGSLGAIIGQFKSACAKRVWAAGFRDFAWQARFYDRIIRDETALHRARAYTADNPAKWDRDRDNPANMWM